MESGRDENCPLPWLSWSAGLNLQEGGSIIWFSVTESELPTNARLWRRTEANGSHSSSSSQRHNRSQVMMALDNKDTGQNL